MDKYYLEQIKDLFNGQKDIWNHLGRINKVLKDLADTNKIQNETIKSLQNKIRELS